MSTTRAGDAPYIDRAFVLEKCSNFVAFQIWPLKAVIDPELWLNNFLPSEKDHAVHLLNSFLFYSEQMTDQLFITGFHNISALQRSPNDDFAQSAQSWKHFHNQIILTYVTGENPNPADSGGLFSRKARQLFGLEENTQIFHPDAALAAAKNEPHRPIIFVDDFVGSGNQFIETWKRPYQIGPANYSWKDHADTHPNTKFFYVPAVSTVFGLRQIQQAAPRVKVSPGNVLPVENNALHPNSNIWPSSLAQSGPQFVHDASMRAGIPEKNGGVGDWRGFNKLGLCFAFWHSTPDATLPIFYWEQNGWNPLVRRR